MLQNLPAMSPLTVNLPRYPGPTDDGHYESWFIRANHPDRPWAFWIRYTTFCPEKHHEGAVGELWATFFDGETDGHVSVKQTFPISACGLDAEAFRVDIGPAVLTDRSAQGRVSTGGHDWAWDLSYGNGQAPLFLLPLDLYERRLPKAKALVGTPLAVFKGILRVDDREIEVRDWVGSQNHNWGARHTDDYAWGQVAGFDNSPDSFLELVTARAKFGPVYTPFVTLVVLRHQGREYALNDTVQGLKATAAYGYFYWQFFTENDDIRIEGLISASVEDFVCLTYLNPPGGSKHCLNTKIAACKLTVTLKTDGVDGETVELETVHRAAMEILTDRDDHGVAVYV